MKKPKLTLAEAKRIIAQQAADAVRTAIDLRRALNRDVEFYAERDAFVAILARRWPAHLMEHPQLNRNWHWIVCVHSPEGQLAWPISDERLSDFAHLERSPNDWDGCTKLQRIARLRRLSRLP